MSKVCLFGRIMRGKRLTVMLVDDSRTVLAQLERVIASSEEAEIVGTATNGTEAVQRAGDLRPDLVIMDIVMPDMDGMAALRLIRSKHPKIRVAMLSSVGGTTSRAEEAFRLGAVQVLSKPVDEDVLGELLTRECTRRRS